MAEPTYDDVIAALRSADASGNTDDARRLAQIASTMKRAPEKPATERLGEAAVKGYAAGGLPLGMPSALAYMGAEGLKIANEKMLQGAYDIGGRVTDVATGIGLSPETSAKLGFGANVGIQAIPAMVATPAAKAASPVMESGARWLMQSAVKPNLSARTSGAAPRAIDTMLDRGIAATGGGLEATQAKVTSLEKTINTILEQSPATVNKFEVAKNLKKAVEDTKLSLSRASNLDEIRKAHSDFWNHDAIKNMSDIPVALANKMKQAFYKELSDKAYVPGAQVTAYDKAEKALAGGIRKEIGAAEPAVVPSLAEQSELINVIKVLGPRVAVEGNKNIIGLGILSPTSEKMLVWMLDRYPWFKSWMAYTMHKGAERIPQAVAGTGVAALTAQRPPQ